MVEQEMRANEWDTKLHWINQKNISLKTQLIKFYNNKLVSGKKYLYLI